ncbi:unnamed protein product, partial [Rodentolepis nana]|uniref:HECT-type E3 ubiquitin transferase n=1 Tax=Rodentolepis nana TaxID=102285 RepID=A0A0R3T2L3_RODNA
MKIDRKKLVNKCGYDQTECQLLAKRLATLPDDEFLKELQKIKVWNYGKCELGLWSDVLDRLDAILEDATTKIGSWTLKVDSAGNEELAQNIVIVLEFTSHLIEHSIYRCLYGSWSHILSLFSTSNLDILLAVLGLAYNFSKRSNYFSRLDEFNRTQINERLSAIAESWGGAEKGFALASCCQDDYIPPDVGMITFEYATDVSPNSLIPENRVISHNFRNSLLSPSEIMEEILQTHKIPPSKQMILFSRLRNSVYYSDFEKRMKCIRARLQAISTLCYAFPCDERIIYPGLLDELVDVVQLPDGDAMSLKACALRTMTAIFNIQRGNMNMTSILESTEMSNFHGALPTRIRKWIKSLVDGTCDASGGSTNQQYTIALLSFLYHLATFEQNIAIAGVNGRTMSSNGILDSMMELIGWHVPRNDYLSYVTRAVRVTDQIISGIPNTSPIRHILLTRLIERLDYETDLVIYPPPPHYYDTLEGESAIFGNESDSPDSLPPLGILNTQRSGLMKSILNLLKRISSEQNWNDAITAVMVSEQLPNVLHKIYSNKAFLQAPHLVLFAIEIITTFIYAFPSNISVLQEKGVTEKVLEALMASPLPAFREFLIQLPVILRSLTLNAAGKKDVLSCGILERYVDTLVSKDYLAVMRSRRTRDPPSYNQGNLNGLGSSNQNVPTGALAIQMAQNFQELIRAHREFRVVVYNAILQGFKKILAMSEEPAKLIPTAAETSGSGGNGAQIYTTASTGGASAGLATGRRRRRLHSHHHHHVGGSGGDGEGMEIDVDVMHVGDDDDVEMEGDMDQTLVQTGPINMPSYVTPDVEDTIEDMLLSGSDGNISDVDPPQDERQTPSSRAISPPASASSSTNQPSASVPQHESANQFYSDPSIENHNNVLDYILNLCKFMERLHGLGPDWDATSRDMLSEDHQLHSREGIETVLNILIMTGLPYEFPSSYSCAVFAQSVLVLLNHVPPSEVFRALLDRLWIVLVEATLAYEELKKKLPGGSRDYFSSMLLNTDNPNSLEMEFLHNLSVLSSIICIVVYLNVHMKSSMRNSFLEIWSEREYLRDLGHLYQEVSWEAAVILSIIREGAHQKGGAVCGTDMEINPADQVNDPSASGDTRNIFPRCVEGLSFFKIITMSLSSNGPVTNAHRVLCVAACFINSAAEVCNTLTCLCTSAIISDPNSSDSGGATAATVRRTNAAPAPAPASGFGDSRPASVQFSPRPSTSGTDTTRPTSNPKMAIIARVALFIAETFVWRPPTPPPPTFSKTRSSQAIPRLQHALQYSTFHLTHVFFDQTSSTPLPNNIILRAFALIGGMQFIFESFSEFLKLVNNKDCYDEETFSKVLEGMLADINRLTDLTSLATDSITSRFSFDLPKYSKYIFTLLLEPLCLICEGDILEKLTFRSVESLLNILKNYVSFIYASDDPETPTTDDPIAEMGLDQEDFESFFNSESTNALLEGIRAMRPSKSRLSLIPKAEATKLASYLKQNLFEACFTIAKHFNSDETIQMVAEVIVSINVESSSIERLVNIVSREFKSFKNQMTSVELSKDAEVALHLLAVYFNRCRFICVRTFSKHGMPDLLYKILITVDTEAADRYSPRLYALCALLINQYERSLTALRLRKRVVSLYKNQHSWAWFDESANLWHEYDPTEVRSADEAFHNGVFRSTTNGRRTQYLEFVPMIQMSDSRVSRPILLFPKFLSPKEKPNDPLQTGKMTRYEEKILYEDEECGQELYQLSLSQRKALCSIIVNSFAKGKLDVVCSDNFLRLLLRFAATSFDDAETIVKSNVLKVLFDYSPPDNWKLTYRCFLAHLIRQLFYNRKALKTKMSEVVGQIFQGSSTLMQWTCRDLFFSLAAVAPLMARNEELALEVFKEHVQLLIPDDSVEDGCLPRSYLIEKNPSVDTIPDVPEKLNDRQRMIVSFLVDRITTRPVSEEPQASTSKPSDKVIFEREICLNVLTDLMTTCRSVAECLCKMKTFITYLFTHGLRGANSNSTIILLMSMIFFASSATQGSVISDFKSTLRTIFNSSSYTQATDSEESMCNNQHIIGLMQFLRGTVNLPQPIQVTIIRHIFKRQVAGDLAKLLAVVNCKVSNGIEALNLIMKMLETFTQIESQLLRRGDAALGNTEPQVSVVTTVADAMMHTAAETLQPLASALVPTIVESVDSVHPAPTTTTSSQRQPSTATQHHHHHITEEGDTWAEAEDASEMGDTTVEDSAAILISDEGGVQTLGENAGGGRGNHDGDNTDGDDDDVDNYHHADDGDDDELTSEESHSQGSVDDDHGGEDEEGDEESNQDEGDDGDQDDGAFTDGNDDDDDDDDFQNNQRTALVTDGGSPHVNLINNLMSHVFDVANTDGGTAHIQNRQNDRGFVLQFTTVSGGDDILPGDRLIDLVTEGSARYNFLGHGSSFFLGETNAATGRGASHSLQNIYRMSNLAIPSRAPLIFLPPTANGTNLGSGSGGVSDASNSSGSVNLRQLRYNVTSASRRDTSGGPNSAYLALLSNNSRGAIARLGALANTPILIRSNFVASGQTPGYLSLAQPNHMHPLQPPFSPLLNGAPRQYRRRQYAQGGSSSIPTTTQRSRVQETSDVVGDNLAIGMLMDLEDISSHAINELTHNTSNGLSGAAVGTVLPLNAFFSVLCTYRHFLATAQILCGQELMDMVLLARHEVGVYAEEERRMRFQLKTEEFQLRQSAIQSEEITAAERQESTTMGDPQQKSTELPVEHEHTTLEPVITTNEPAFHQRPEELATPVVRLVDIGPRLTTSVERLLTDLISSDI